MLVSPPLPSLPHSGVWITQYICSIIWHFIVPQPLPTKYWKCACLDVLWAKICQRFCQISIIFLRKLTWCFSDHLLDPAKKGLENKWPISTPPPAPWTIKKNKKIKPLNRRPDAHCNLLAVSQKELHFSLFVWPLFVILCARGEKVSRNAPSTCLWEWSLMTRLERE